ncbi:1-(5-phosphoribosyl)-5-[(5-phosphoribosylamino)methylideneamino]imidazole-4-carboxamide isomerase [Candidatus Roizmanbacteria bacterium RIFCSPHIGHO2_02_FULL_37_13b]|uniref:1-(5-phosphoribosyl)-5-[(5-phosphoribosylamino)methylideneamino] imidazole-4-carboxamide isomerase n=1 Tax=Candidatus Roizmanbacteria bacterium RIFCSPLOWO2_02_FULL_36_11 TaxID=1802071 RepID=A0A1F7JCD6_9BACT|nr:MAG: 1-(5-phosphoribosyl)-5-[(5-phosphoribosylamino)methylideneamino]imidazole-4-carboxamide isomerase [Candidatus Roizmanbacteria bacterium RIFCSPHIGHO2_02_FULL_37_13b]OGK53274.1 MAG: 1-(5-phosphoribosyl)-5-[(5-phosphoribosylamino)methylideneamino]imidazole-4-carboxamide isomerase [Candidatus Roizmanbacteria bacterium RIFCSPLOWO2_02_FULL_36_11]
MKILPAVDIKNGKCVRLTQGDYSRETIYENDPVIIAKKWQSQGAKDLHIIDLDGAREGKTINLKVIADIIEDTGLTVQVGGGIRTIKSAQKYFEIGMSRLILGTVAIDNQELLKEFIDKFGEKIIVSLDVKNKKLAKKGWINLSNDELIPKAKEIEQLGVNTIIYTDTNRDGMLTEPNYRNIVGLKKAVKINVVIAGGVTNIDQVAILKRLKVDGIIIGKALYEGSINLEEVLKYAD